MAQTTIHADQSGITIHLPNLQPYHIGWWQIEKDGFSYWHNHLMEKSWYNDELSRKFADMCMEHSCEAY